VKTASNLKKCWNMEAKERGWYVYGRGAAAMEVGSSRGVQSGGDVRV
jgi:hypothetical protein